MYSTDIPGYQTAGFIGYFVIHGYAFIAHHYNRILANERLSVLKTESIQKKSDKLMDNNNKQSVDNKKDGVKKDGKIEEEDEENEEDDKSAMLSIQKCIWPSSFLLKDDDDDDDNDDKKDENVNQAKSTYWTLCFRPDYTRMSPQFVKSKRTLVLYRDYLMTLPEFQSIDLVSKGLFCKEIDPPSLYRQFIEKQAKQPKSV